MRPRKGPGASCSGQGQIQVDWVEQRHPRKVKRGAKCASVLMSRKGPEVGEGRLDFVRIVRLDLVLH